MRDTERGARALVTVLGANPEGSAVAHRLHAAGYAVVLVDDVDPAWTRRGRAYTDAWYVGTCELAGTAAVFCASVRSIPSIVDRGRAIAATTWSPRGIDDALRPVALIDARLADGRRDLLLRDLAGGASTDVVAPIGEQATAPADTLHAPTAGRFHTRHAIGDVVTAGEVVGSVGTAPLATAAAGRLLGLAARGARVRAGQCLVEVDPRLDRAGCFGLEREAAVAAERIVTTLAQFQSGPGACAGAIVAAAVP